MSTRKSKAEVKDKDVSVPEQILTCLPWQNEDFDRIVRQKAVWKIVPCAADNRSGNTLGSYTLPLLLPARCSVKISRLARPAGTVRDVIWLLLVPIRIFEFLKPEDSKLIKIEQIRNVIAWVNQTAQRSGKKVVIVHPADQMTHQSANALLKCLEEPAGDSLIMLVTSHPGRLLPTIRSRCQLVEFHIPPKAKATDWLLEQPEYGERSSVQTASNATQRAELLLDIAGGAPLAVLDRFDEAFLERREIIVKSVEELVSGSKNAQQVSEILSKTGAGDAIECMFDIAIDCLKYLSCGDLKYIRNKDMALYVENISSSFDLEAMFALSESLRIARQELTSASNPDPLLLIETLVISMKSLSQSLVPSRS